MKISEMVSKSVIDDAISKSENLEGLCTVLLSLVVGAVVTSLFSKKDKEKGVIK